MHTHIHIMKVISHVGLVTIVHPEAISLSAAFLHRRLRIYCKHDTCLRLCVSVRGRTCTNRDRQHGTRAGRRQSLRPVANSAPTRSSRCWFIVCPF